MWVISGSLSPVNASSRLAYAGATISISDAKKISNPCLRSSSNRLSPNMTTAG